MPTVTWSSDSDKMTRGVEAPLGYNGKGYGHTGIYGTTNNVRRRALSVRNIFGVLKPSSMTSRKESDEAPKYSAHVLNFGSDNQRALVPSSDLVPRPRRYSRQCAPLCSHRPKQTYRRSRRDLKRYRSPLQASGGSGRERELPV